VDFIDLIKPGAVWRYVNNYNSRTSIAYVYIPRNVRSEGHIQNPSKEFMNEVRQESSFGAWDC